MRGIPSQTAEAVCLMRATEQRVDPGERIVDDPYAALFLSPPWRAALAAWPLARPLRRWSPGLTTFVLTRHRFVDDALAATIVDGLDQLVLLGAGYDSRAFRFGSALSGPTYEVDHPATSRRKEAVVRRRADLLPEARIVRVPVDFERESLEERLLASGFERGARTFWVWEGVSMYLQREAVASTLATVRALSGPGSRLAMDFWRWPDEPTWRGRVWRATPALLGLIGEPVTFGLDPGDAGAFLAASGLRLEDLADATALEERYVRDGRRVFPFMYTATASVLPLPPAAAGAP